MTGSCCGTAKNLTSGVSFLATAGRPLHGLYIHRVTAPEVRPAGILLSTAQPGGTLTDYMVSENLARVVNTMTTHRGVVCNNLPETQGHAESAAPPGQP